MKPNTVIIVFIQPVSDVEINPHFPSQLWALGFDYREGMFMTIFARMTHPFLVST